MCELQASTALSDIGTHKHTHARSHTHSSASALHLNLGFCEVEQAAATVWKGAGGPAVHQAITLVVPRRPTEDLTQCRRTQNPRT
jgi:hypothetical protein